MTDWPTIISDLQAAWGRIELARKAGAGVSTLADLATGKTKEPRHTLGQKLLRLHRQANAQPTEARNG